MNKKRRFSFSIPIYVHNILKDVSKKKCVGVSRLIRQACIKTFTETILEKYKDLKHVKVNFLTTDNLFIEYIDKLSKEHNIRQSDILKICCVLFAETLQSRKLETKTDSTFRKVNKLWKP